MTAKRTLFYDPRDDGYHEKVRGQILYWLDDLGTGDPYERGEGDGERRV